MRFAYADPPYIGCAKHYPEQQEIDHPALVARLVQEFPDGWALSCHVPSLRDLLPLCPANIRILAWLKSFAVFKPNVTLAYTWEPVLLCGGRPRPRTEPTIRDHLVAPITIARGIVGAKPLAFCEWILDAFFVQPGDEVIDLYPGTGIMGHATNRRLGPHPQLPLELVP